MWEEEEDPGPGSGPGGELREEWDLGAASSMAGCREQHRVPAAAVGSWSPYQIGLVEYLLEYTPQVLDAAPRVCGASTVVCAIRL
eukprot:g12973.t1